MPATDIQQLAEEAYVFAYPLLYNYQTLYTQTQDATFGGYIGGFGGYRHYARPSTPADTDIVTPNNDTLYSWAWLDLRRGPVVFETPAFDEGRYAVFQWLDLHTYIFASHGTRTGGSGPHSYLFAGPDRDGDVPAGIDEVFRSEGDFVGTLTRTGVAGAADVPAARTLQRQYRFTPLSGWTGTKPPPPAPAPNFPAWHEELAKGPGFIAYLNFVLGHVKLNPQDEAALTRFAALGVAPGAAFDPAMLDAATRAAIQRGINAALARLTDRSNKQKDNIGLFGPRAYLGDDYEARAIGAMMGIYGQNEQDAVYFAYQLDAEGQPLDGTKTYELRFETPPKVSVFWSLTMYNLPQRLLVANPIERYSIGDRTPGLVTDANGGVTLTIGATDPGPGRNWLPCPASGPFFMVMRLYGPDQSIIDGQWPRPLPSLVTAAAASAAAHA